MDPSLPRSIESWTALPSVAEDRAKQPAITHRTTQSSSGRSHWKSSQGADAKVRARSKAARKSRKRNRKKK